MNMYLTIEELIEKSDVIRPYSRVKNKNDCLNSWRDELQRASDIAERQKK